jgi:hypothetical protein
MTWNCPQCDTVNESVSSACAICGRLRPGGSSTGAAPVADVGAPTTVWGAPIADSAPARWCQACGSAVAPDLRFCGRCGADQQPGAGAPAAVVAAPAGYATSYDETYQDGYDDAYDDRAASGAGRTIAAILGVIFVAVVAAVGAFVLASRASNTAAPPTGSSDPTSPAVSAGTSSSTSSTSSTSSSSTSSTAAPTTTSGAPGPTAPAGKAIAPADASKSDLAALDLAQQLATALAAKDAGALAKLEPGKAPGGYEDLKASTAILKSVTPVKGSVYTVRLGLVAHEETTDRHSHVYCVTWTIDVDAGHVTETGKDSTASELLPGWVDPATMVQYVRTSC